MPKPNSSLIDAALTAALLADSQLTALLPDGVFFDVAADGAQRFLIISLLAHSDAEATFEGRTIEDGLYLVKAVSLSSSGVDMNTAAARIDVLLEDVPLVVNGFTWMDTHREERLRITEVDPVDPRLRWQHRGGHYRVRMSI